MRVLFIGGTGNISTATSRLAASRGIDLFLLNNDAKAPEIPGAKFIFGDINDPTAISRALAGQTWDVVVDWIAFNANDIERDLNLFRGKTRQFICISSASCYQKPPVSPLITESTPLVNPYWAYSQGKIACEDRLMKAFREESFPFTVVRPSHTYSTVIPAAIGSWTDYTLIERMKRGLPFVCHGDGSNLWTITHAEDFAKGFVGLLGREQAIGQAYHITSDEHLTWNQIYQYMAEAVGVEPKMVHVPTDLIIKVDPTKAGMLLGDKAHSVIFDNTKIKTLVPEFQAVIPFQQGFKRTIAWFESDKSRQKIDQANFDLQDRILAVYRKAFPEA